MADGINSQERVARIGIDHNPFCAPQGKVIGASAEHEGNRFVLKGQGVAQDEVVVVQISNTNEELLGFIYDDYPQLFGRSPAGDWGPASTIAIDPTSFEDHSDAERFLLDCATIDGFQSGGQFFRKSIIADPAIHILLSDPNLVFALFVGGQAAYWILNRILTPVNHVIDESTKRQANRLVDALEPKITAVIDKFLGFSRSRPDAPLTVKLTIPGDDIEITLLRHISDPADKFPLDTNGLNETLEEY